MKNIKQNKGKKNGRGMDCAPNLPLFMIQGIEIEVGNLYLLTSKQAYEPLSQTTFFLQEIRVQRLS